MKWTAAFLVLLLVVLMAQPGECIFGMIVHGLFHAGKLIHGLIHGNRGFEEQEDLNKRSVEFAPDQPAFD
ncbi:pleurocidin-like peptide WF3 [Syngnathoides biaculeatus]|uniref:pleurocidin-like peptide WF3 n=1 Tax=Syngnathoides biaculeatus TaxID=300417 RepID=UPI002ADDB20B|nr:pleurocidin-like peptide WF3 [Syngnathoides biaculeatus]